MTIILLVGQLRSGVSGTLAGRRVGTTFDAWTVTLDPICFLTGSGRLL